MLMFSLCTLETRQSELVYRPITFRDQKLLLFFCIFELLLQLDSGARSSWRYLSVCMASSVRWINSTGDRTRRLPPNERALLGRGMRSVDSLTITIIDLLSTVRLTQGHLLLRLFLNTRSAYHSYRVLARFASHEAPLYPTRAH